VMRSSLTDKAPIRPGVACLTCCHNSPCGVLCEGNEVESRNLWRYIPTSSSSFVICAPTLEHSNCRPHIVFGHQHCTVHSSHHNQSSVKIPKSLAVTRPRVASTASLRLPLPVAVSALRGRPCGPVQVGADTGTQVASGRPRQPEGRQAREWPLAVVTVGA
jgi:hypothetical protein